MNPGVESYLFNLPEKEHNLATQVYHHIMDLTPVMQCAIKWGIPFFDYFSPFAYLNRNRQRGLELCFMKGYVMSDHGGLLYQLDRKLVKSIALNEEALFESETYWEILQEAIYLNENWNKLKKPMDHRR